MHPLLEIDRLTVSAGPDRPPLLDGISLELGQGEVLAMVGESGSGKSLTALSVMQLLPAGLSLEAASLRLDGTDLTRLGRRELNSLHGGRIGMLFQQPRRMLDPTASVGSQVAEPLRLHLGMSRRAARARVLELLAEVGIDDPARRASAYPHQLSGGLAQRVMIATALAAQPPLLIADEPTTALDATVESQILELIAQKKNELGMSVLFISHDLGVVSSVADRIAVMYAGRIVEVGSTAQILRMPQHPYTQALVRCSTLSEVVPGELYVIPGGSEDARAVEHGCRFAPRCDVARAAGAPAECHGSEPTLVSHRTEEPHHATRCWLADEELSA